MPKLHRDGEMQGVGYVLYRAFGIMTIISTCNCYIESKNSKVAIWLANSRALLKMLCGTSKWSAMKFMASCLIGVMP